MNKLKDTDLREALRRKYANTPQLPDDFMDSVMKRMEAEPKPAKKVRLWRWAAAAACLMLLVGLGVTHMPHKEQQNKSLLADKAVQTKTETRKDEIQSPSEGKQEHIEEKVRTGRTQSPHGTDSEFVRDGQKTSSRESSEQMGTVVVANPNLHYAAQIEIKDTVPYQAPSRVDEFIAKLAEYNKVKGVPLNCTSDIGPDTTIVSTAYLFEDKPEIDLFAKLLQVACWYDPKTPGYLLNFSRRQFIFCLDDPRKGEKYLWIAERIGSERILLFSTHSPKKTVVSSACFQDYREQLTHKGINILNF